MIKGYRKVCPLCDKAFEYTSEKLLEHNFNLHLDACKLQEKIKKLKEGGKK